MNLKEIIKSKEFKWINLFIRDMLLIVVIVIVDYTTDFRSRWIAFIMGMLLVWITWQFADYLNYVKINKKWT